MSRHCQYTMLDKFFRLSLYQRAALQPVSTDGLTVKTYFIMDSLCLIITSVCQHRWFDCQNMSHHCRYLMFDHLFSDWSKHASVLSLLHFANLSPVSLSRQLCHISPPHKHLLVDQLLGVSKNKNNMRTRDQKVFGPSWRSTFCADSYFGIHSTPVLP